MIEKWLAFVKGHEKIILVLGVAILCWLGWRKYIEHRDATDHDLAVVQREKVQADAKAAGVAQQQVQQLQQQVSQLAADNGRLRIEVMNAISLRNQQTSERKVAESTAPLNDVARRWAELARIPAGSLTATGESGVVADAAAARITTQTLEDGATAAANLADTQRLDAGKDAQISGLNDLVKSMDSSAKAQQILLADQVQSCKADLKVAKDDGAKRGRRGFWRGLAVGAGIVGGIVLRFI